MNKKNGTISDTVRQSVLFNGLRREQCRFDGQ